jgi:hypothetical protein
MGQQAPGMLPYDLDTITRNAPPVSGVYAIFSPSECVYVGESEDICASLLEFFFEENPCLSDKFVSHFTFEIVSPDSRLARQAECIRGSGPVCNLRTKSAACGPCRLAKEKGPRARMPVLGASCA